MTSSILGLTTVTDLGPGASATTIPGAFSIISAPNIPPTSVQLVTVHVGPSDAAGTTPIPSGTAATEASGNPLPITTQEYQGSTTITGPLTYTNTNDSVIYVQTLSSYPALSDVPGTSTPSSSNVATPTSASATGTDSTNNTTVSANSTSTASASATATSDSGFSSAALAGGIVGAAVGGAILAFLAACLFFRRKPRAGSRAGALMDEKPHVYPWDAYLPQSVDDETIRRSVESLYSQIDMHVENYYGGRPAAGNPNPALLAKVDSGKFPGSISSILASTSTPAPVIKHCFAWVILTQLSPGKEGEPSLLPPEFAHVPPQLSVVTNGKGGAREDHALPQAYKYWRVLTAHLMYPRSGKKSINLNDIPSARDCFNTLGAAFAPWFKGGDAGREHLASVIKTASETGLLLVSQPSSFDFAWNREPFGKSSSNIVTFPALEKTADERGTGLQQRQVLVKSRAEPISR